MNPEQRPRYPELDGLRGIAILMVVAYHYFAYPAALASPVWLSRVTVLATGVDLFFVLSGYLLGGILMDNKGAKNYFSTFYLRRACRILPPYLAVVLAFFVLTALIPLTAGHDVLGQGLAWLFQDPYPWWSYLTFTQNFVVAARNIHAAHFLAPTWTLALEEQFYLVLPLLIFLVPRRLLPFVLAGLVLAVVGGRVAPLSLAESPEQYQGYLSLLPFRADGLFLGVLAAWMMHGPGGGFAKRHQAALYVVLAVTFSGSYWWDTLAPWFLLEPGARSISMFLLVLAYCAVLILAVTEERGPVAFVTRNRVLGAVGIVSYGAYLFHQPVSGILHGLFFGAVPCLESSSQLLVSVLALAITFGLATASWVFFEKRIVDWGRSFRYGKDRRRPSSSAGEEATDPA